MKHSTGKPTKAEAARMERLSRMPCVACRQLDTYLIPLRSEVHHLLSGNRRRGHMFTVPLCSWHHRGVRYWEMDPKAHPKFFGPSLALSSKAFRARFGTDDELLAMTDKLLEGT